MPLLALDRVTIDIPVLDASRSFRRAFFSRYTGGAIASTGSKVMVRALDSISLTLNDGDRLGIVGHNGSGKTTILRAMAGIYEPTSGTISREGRVTSMFNPLLGTEMDETGLQNITNIGLHLGFSKAEIAGVVDDVIDFCELGDFINLPVRTYSSGMLVRLGFAMATALQPEILILDEAIGAGDARFAERIRERLDRFFCNVRILAVATHSDSLIRQLCNKAVLLEHGKIVEYGDVETVLAAYAAAARR